MGSLNTIFYSVVTLGILIFVHEFGHFIAAKLTGMRVDRFSIGFPPRAFGKKIGDTDYCISWVPLGGYVKIAGMVDESMDTDFANNDAPAVGIPCQADVGPDPRDLRRRDHERPAGGHHFLGDPFHPREGLDGHDRGRVRPRGEPCVGGRDARRRPFRQRQRHSRRDVGGGPTADLHREHGA